MHKDADTIRGDDNIGHCDGNCNYGPVLSNMLFQSGQMIIANKQNKRNFIMHALYNTQYTQGPNCLLNFSLHGPFKTESRPQLSGVQAVGAG